MSKAGCATARPRHEVVRFQVHFRHESGRFGLDRTKRRVFDTLLGHRGARSNLSRRYLSGFPLPRSAHRWRSHLRGFSPIPCATGLRDLSWFRGVAILIPEIRGDLVGRIRIEYSVGRPHRCWMLMVAFSFAASVAPTGAAKRISPAHVGASDVGRPRAACRVAAESRGTHGCRAGGITGRRRPGHRPRH